MKPSGTVKMVGLLIVKRGLPVKIPIPGSGFHTLGLSMTSMMELSNPNNISVIAPVALKRFQYIVQRMIGKLALAAIPSARTERKATFID